jgi:hypothetical protein
MTLRYLRNEPSRKDSTAAAVVSGVLAASVGLVTFYFVRLFLAREVAGEADDGHLHDPDRVEE